MTVRPATFASSLALQEMLIDAQRLWAFPLTLSACWWGTMAEMLCQRPYEHADHEHPHHCDPHDQLVVPEPIEAEGEHALFA